MSDITADDVSVAKVPSNDRAEDAKKLRHLYVAWVRFQRRPESMRNFVGYDLAYFPPPYTAKWAKPFGYLHQAISTIAAIRRHRPDVLWFQSPPTFIAHLLVAYRAVFDRRLKLVADCHNMALDPAVPGNSWTKLPGALTILNRIDVALAHNHAVREKALGLGVSPEKLLVLETRPAPLPLRDESQESSDRDVILVPCSYHDDEPIEMLLETARNVPEATFMLTGNLARAQSKRYPDRAPENVRFTGYLTAEAYTELLTTCSLVIGLTTGEGIQLSGANEAVGAGRPMVLSDTKLLRALFGDAALFAQNETAAMTAAVRQALGSKQELRAASRRLKATREARWQGQANACLERLVG
ncbi:glycosyltransferase [Aureimonas jatrophae]|uniref:Glycosyltransferase involved in cell wall bisynthesis n=1 Tax=Aureimonas jatrophae TaxID=1166073 RepID=A0A1H0NBX8_9HYPH|nr:glycosyltransferase [Aureimonas jatrophae]MBB3951190.1 glycosyltransferase involved in cell wall biosynthesis [Aureimonas jatrophae]SDO90161.1 Glycosyltransferase involved in cell wall bisynthesis [Aureimonas jatrophae]